MGIETDFLIDYTNKRVYHNAGSTVYTVNALYTLLMDTFDEIVQMDDTVPMSAQTPTEYTMINGWFIDDVSVQYLSGGAIKTSGYLNAIQVVTLVAGGYVGAIGSDIGKLVTDDGGNTGNLIAYDNVLRKWWIRWGTTVAASSTMAITGGTGAGVTIASGSTTGEDLYANAYTLGTIESSPAPQVYVYQNKIRVAEWSALSNWDPGQIDVLLKVKEAGTLIDGGLATVLARQSGDLFSHFSIDLSAGGRNAIPLGTSDDLNEDTGEHYLLYDGQTSAFVNGERLNGQTSGATAELVLDTDNGTTGILKLRNVRGVFANDENIRSGVTVRAVANGVVGDTLLTYDAQSANFSSMAQVLTGSLSGAKRLLRGQQDNGAAGILVCSVNGAVFGVNRTPYYKAFVDNDVVSGASEGSCTLDAASTTLVAGWDDITVAFVNGTVTHGGTTGTFASGERVTWSAGAQSGIVLKDASGTLTLGNCTNTALNGVTVTGDKSGATCSPNQNLQSAHTMTKAFEQQSANPYDVIVECGALYNAGRTLAQVYEYLKYLTHDGQLWDFYTVVAGVITKVKGENYIQAYTGYSPVVTAPFGTFAGGKLFGAQGVWVEGMALSQSYQVIDSNGVGQAPYASVNIVVSSVVSGDRVSVFRANAGVVDEAVFTSHAADNDIGDADFIINAAIPIDTPPAGALRVVHGTTKQRYRYSSWATSTFTLTAVPGGTADAGSTGATLEDAASDFVTNVQVGDMITNTQTGESGIVTAIADATHLTAALPSNWTVGDTFVINKLTANYDGTTKAYAPFVDEQAAGTSVSKTVLYASNRDVLVRVRKKGILPFESPGTVTSTGLSVAANRTTDGIVT
jgi:hypothetical protein